ncbi:MAG: TetR/AcrR family transcriptional regulator [Acidimicrobiales bacterium]
MARRTGPDQPVRARNRRGEGERLRDDLIAAARALLAAANAESDLSIRKVAQAVGVTPQAFYLRFATLDELLFAVYSAEFAGLHAALDCAAAGLAPSVAALRAMCDAYGAFAVERPVPYRLMTGTKGTFHEDWDPSKLPGAPVLAMLRGALGACASGRHGALEPDGAVVQLWATLHGIVTLRDGRPTFPWPPLDDMVRSAVDSAITAVRSPSQV